MKKSFDAVQCMRERRRRIDEEGRDLTWDEQGRRTHEVVLRCATTPYDTSGHVRVGD
jgi:hypothetical protein